MALNKLAHGKHYITVHARLGDESHAASRTLEIKVLPPFYLTPIAKITYFLAGLALFFSVIFLILRRSRLKREELRREQADKLMEDKLQFFTDISHEIRTPLTLVLSPIAEMKKNADKRTLRTFEMMENNGARILRMISQIIDLRKIDNKRMALHIAPSDIRSLLSRITEAFAILTAQHKLELTVDVSDEVPEQVWIDADKIDKVVFNVVSNAIRFSPDEGKIHVEADMDGTGKLRIRVADQGPGIAPEMFETIFERFFRIEDNSSNRGGTGIGLHLSRKLMLVHHGSIYVESSSASGTVFAIVLPADAADYSETEIVGEDYNVRKGELSELPAVSAEPQDTDNLVTTTKAHSILVVEDDAAILNYLKTNLRSQYNVITARNGAEGLEAALRYRPHCIITDIMMPEMDGTEMCRCIRANSDICEIPVIMLTAKAAEDQRLEGLEAGADDYVTKPFSIGHLAKRIGMLIHSRRVLKQKFGATELMNEEVTAMQSADDKLLARVESFVVRELANPDLSVELIASETGVSRSHLHRRLKVLTGMSPSNYIRQARMRHAAILLSEKRMAVSEVAYATGFSSLSHFSTVFKEFHGMSPTQFAAIKADMQQ